MLAPSEIHLPPALSSAAMREADRCTIEEIGIPGITLMESAGRAAVQCMVDRYGSMANQSVAVFCGKGNNGGDGFVVARLLATQGALVTIFMMAPANDLSPDAAKNHQILKNLIVVDESIQVTFSVLKDSEQLPASASFNFIVDGLLGTGVTRSLRQLYRDVVDWINDQEATIIALDLPTGLHTDTGAVLGSAVRADLTVTMGAIKAGLLLGQGMEFAGEVLPVEIGIPEAAVLKAAQEFHCARVVTQEAVKSWLPRRSLQSHKYGVGMALVVAGSTGLTGAAALASMAASVSGAGAVVCATDEQVQQILDIKLTEVMTLGLPSTERGISADALETLELSLAKAKSLLVGCGMGRRSDSQAFIRSLVTQNEMPVVIDADGLNAFVDHVDLFKKHADGNWILTPHLGEFRRLAGEDVDLSDPVATVRQFATTWNCTLVLKGAPTIVGDPTGQVFISPLVNPALATAGSGDILAGLCAGFLAQGLSPLNATLTSLYLGGLAANRYTAHHNAATMLASDLIDQFKLVMNDFKQ